MASELRVDKIVPVDGVPTGGGGGIVQVVFAQTNAAASQSNAATTQTTLFFTNLQATITPKFSTSKILVKVNQNYNLHVASDAQMQANFFICNTSGTILQGGSPNFDQIRLKNIQAHAGIHSIDFLHSPNTTSAFTYKVYGNNYYCSSGTSTLDVHTGSRANAFSTMTLMEVSA